MLSKAKLEYSSCDILGCDTTQRYDRVPTSQRTTFRVEVAWSSETVVITIASA